MIYSIKNIILRLSLFSIGLLLLGSLHAQNRIDIYGNRNSNLGIKTSYRAGITPETLKDDSKWLNYTILLKENEPSYSVTAQIVGGDVPEGIVLKLRASYYMGPGEGAIGTPTGEIVLSSIPQVILENIGTAHTGSGVNVGHRLIYTIELEDLSYLATDLSSLQIIFTLTQ